MKQFRITLPETSKQNAKARQNRNVGGSKTSGARAKPITDPSESRGKGTIAIPSRDSDVVRSMQQEEDAIVWKQRSRDSYEFMPALLEVMDRPASPTGRIVLYIIISFFAVLVVWATFGRVDIVAVARGTIQPAGGAIPVQASVSGNVAQVFVREGDKVAEGDILLTLDDREAIVPRAQIEERLLRQAIAARVNTRLLELLEAPIKDRLGKFTLPDDLVDLVETQAQARYASHQAEMDSLSAQIAEVATRLNVSRSHIEERAAMLPTYRQHERNLAELAERGLAKRSDWLEVQISLRQQEEALLVEEGQLEILAAQIDTLRATRASRLQAARYTAVEQLLEAQQAGSIALLERQRLKTTGEHLTVRAPRSGIVSNFDIKAGATLAQPGLVVMSILPDDNLIVEAHLPSRDIGFVAEGMEVAVKVDAYPFTRFGHLDGIITAISPDSTILDGQQGPTYQLTIETTSDALEVNDNSYPISSGMEVSADVRTGNRTILDYFLSPINASVGETLRER